MNEYAPEAHEAVGSPNGQDHTYRKFLPDLKTKKYTDLAKRTAKEHPKRLFEDIPAVAATFDQWKALQAEPFRGVTVDGKFNCSELRGLKCSQCIT